MMVTAHCATCGEVDFDTIERNVTTRFEGNLVIQTISIRCLQCGGSSSKEYREYLTSWMQRNGYKSVTDVQPKPAKKRRK